MLKVTILTFHGTSISLETPLGDRISTESRETISHLLALASEREPNEEGQSQRWEVFFYIPVPRHEGEKPTGDYKILFEQLYMAVNYRAPLFEVYQSRNKPYIVLTHDQHKYRSYVRDDFAFLPPKPLALEKLDGRNLISNEPGWADPNATSKISQRVGGIPLFRQDNFYESLKEFEIKQAIGVELEFQWQKQDAARLCVDNPSIKFLRNKDKLVGQIFLDLTAIEKFDDAVKSRHIVARIQENTEVKIRINQPFQRGKYTIRGLTVSAAAAGDDFEGHMAIIIISGEQKILRHKELWYFAGNPGERIIQ